MRIVLLLPIWIAFVYAIPTVRIGKTAVIGKVFGPSQVEFFGGIPFAEPPLGELRLNSPVIVKELPGPTFLAEEFGLACVQTILPVNQVSEDCLTINIFRPVGIPQDAKLPVMVWIYGGGFVAGASFNYNGTGIVSHSSARGTPIIFVNFNYRLGPLGFPSTTEAVQQNVANLGLQDQLVALEWIQENIEKFGGDKSKVTVFGESSGANSIVVHLQEIAITKLARAVILESMSPRPTFGPEPISEASWQQYISAIPACAPFASTGNTIDCLRRLDTLSVIQAFAASNFGMANATSYQPIIDGRLILDRPSKLIPKARLPILLGTNLDEGTIFAPQATNSTEQIRQFLIASTSPPIVSPEEQAATITGILDLYPDIPALESPFGTGNDTFGLNSQFKRFAAIWGDFFMHSTTRTAAQNMSASGIKVFAYYFTDPDAKGVFIPDLLSNTPVTASLGVCHTSEIFYVFDTLPEAKRTPNSIALIKNMQDYWISFVTSLDPNDKHGNVNRPHWEPYTPQNQVLMELNGQNTRLIPDTFREAQIAFFQGHADALHR